MRTARRGGLEAALMGRVLTIVRGESVLNIPVGELPDLLAVLKELQLTTWTAPAAALSETSGTATVAAPVAPKPRRARRGRVWEGVKNFLGQQGRAQGFSTLLKMVKQEQLTDRDPAHALRIALGKKVSSGELLQTQSGRYTLPKTVSGTLRPSGESKPKTRSQRKHRPGELWKQVKAHMAAHGDALSLDELVDAAAAGKWTNAESPRHAVKICLSRVGDQVVRLPDGRFMLAGAQPPAAAAPASGVKRRKKQDVPVARVQGDFQASTFYPTPRSRQPR